MLCTKKQFTKIYEDPTDVYQKQIQQQYTIYPDMRYGLSWTTSQWIAYCQGCLYTQAGKYKHLGTIKVFYLFIRGYEKIIWEQYNRRGPVLYVVVITAVWTVLVNICDLEL